MTTYAVEFINGVTMDVVASTRRLATEEAESEANEKKWPSTTARGTWLYDTIGRRGSFKPAPKYAQ